MATISLEKASAIAREFPSPSLLLQAYRYGQERIYSSKDRFTWLARQFKGRWRTSKELMAVGKVRVRWLIRRR